LIDGLMVWKERISVQLAVLFYNSFLFFSSQH